MIAKRKLSQNCYILATAQPNSSRTQVSELYLYTNLLGLQFSGFI